MAALDKITKIERKFENRWAHLGHTFRRVIVVIVLLLAGARLILPYVIKSYVNRQLSKLPEYVGQVSGIDLGLWRGAYKIHGLQISKTGGAVPVPFFSAPLIDLSLQWRELFHGAMVGEILLDRPQLNFVSGPTEGQTQSGKDQPWEKTVASFYPFQLNQFQIRGGTIHFRDFFKSEMVDIYLTNLDLVATNLGNAHKNVGKLPAGIHATAGTLGNGTFVLSANLNPVADGPTYEMNAQVTNVDLVALNGFLRSYSKADVERGTFSLFTSVASVDGKYEGFIKVMFKNLDVFAWEKERKKDILEIFWEGVVGTLGEGFKNHPHDQLATQIPISGDYEKSHVGVVPAAGYLLRNAFVKALVPNVGQPVHVEDVKKK